VDNDKCPRSMATPQAATFVILIIIIFWYYLLAYLITMYSQSPYINMFVATSLIVIC